MAGPGAEGTLEGRGGDLENATHWAWRSSLGEPVDAPLSAEALGTDAATAARQLLGSRIRSRVDGLTTEGVVVEAEAYVGPHDPASHAAEAVGRTGRNESMFGPPGRAYVYLSYGIHWCLNVVTDREGYPSAVLIRALDPRVGMEAMIRRRGGRMPICAGPGRVCQALGVTGTLDGHPLDRPPLELLRGWEVPDSAVGVSGRVGVGKAAHWPLRFFLKGHPEVSRGRVEQPPEP